MSRWSPLVEKGSKGKDVLRKCVVLSHCFDPIPDKELHGQSFILLSERLQSIMAGKTWWQVDPRCWEHVAAAPGSHNSTEQDTEKGGCQCSGDFLLFPFLFSLGAENVGKLLSYYSMIKSDSGDKSWLEIPSWKSGNTDVGGFTDWWQVPHPEGS